MAIRGCLLEIIDKSHIKKYTLDKNYIIRLKNQILKQQNFKDIIKKSQTYFNVPNITFINETENSFSAVMNFIDGQSCVEYFEKCSSSSLNNFISEIINFINFELKNSKIENVTDKIIIKFNDVVNNIKQNQILCNDNEINLLIDFYKEYVFNNNLICEIPIGLCHGDLTLSNMIFKSNEVYLIDFLDSFIETPLMDIVKLRQDTKYNWSYLLVDNKQKLSFEISKSNFYKIDCEITDYYSNQSFYKNGYLVLQILNFFRIFQYAKKEQIINYLKMILNDLKKDLNN